MPRHVRLIVTIALVSVASALSASSASSATTFGSALQNAPVTGTCMNFLPIPNFMQCHYAISDIVAGARAPGGLTAPAKGVIVRWRFRNGPTTVGDAKAMLRVFAGNTQRGTSSLVSIPAIAGTTANETRIPVEAGDRLGVTISGTPPIMGTSVTSMLFSGVGAGTLDTFPSAPETGVALVPFNQANNELAVNADVEPDADGDGYGDESQDLCPTSSSLQAVCPTTAIGALKFRPRLGFTLTLSEASSLDLAVERLTKGRLRSGKCSARAKRGQRCTIVKTVKRYTNLAAGAGSTIIPFATNRLKAGSYRATVTAHNPSGVATSKSIRFTVRRR